MSCVDLSLLAFPLNSSTESAEESYINMGASENLPAALTRCGQSVWERKPVLTLLASTLAWEQSILWASCSLDISRLKTATPCFSTIPTCSAMQHAKALLPIEGLPATTISSPPCNPDVILSKSSNPVARPVTLVFLL